MACCGFCCCNRRRPREMEKAADPQRRYCPQSKGNPPGSGWLDDGEPPTPKTSTLSAGIPRDPETAEPGRIPPKLNHFPTCLCFIYFFFFFFFKDLLFIYLFYLFLAALGLSCGTRDLSLRRGLLVVTCGFSLL